MTLLEKRNALKLSQREAAMLCGLSLTGYQNIEKGITKHIKPETQRRIDKCFEGVENYDRIL